jgi:membrane-anchored mycosin MYCP
MITATGRGGCRDGGTPLASMPGPYESEACMPGRIAFVGLLATATVLVTGPAPAAAVPPPITAAAPVCTSPPVAGATLRDLPWPQRRYAPERLAALATGDGVTVAVIDSGVDSRHPQLRGRVQTGRDYLDSGDGRRDCVDHGTAVASIIAARPRDDAGLRGLAPDAMILPVRVSEQQIFERRETGRRVSAAEFANAIRWAVDRGADVLNLSVVLYADHAAVREAVSYAIARDAVVVAAAGNLRSEGNPMPYPAAYAGVIGVGSIGPDGTRSTFSQLGPYVDLVAPGGDVIAAAAAGGHKRQNGTSYAVPFVAATAALVRGYRPDLSAPEVVARILAATDPAPGGAQSTAYGAGVLNPYRAVTDTMAAADPRPTPTLRRVIADPALLTRAERRAQSRQTALWLAAAGAALTGMVVLLAVVLSRGAERRWRPADRG